MNEREQIAEALQDEGREWKRFAACRGEDTELFFPQHSTQGKRRPQVRRMVAKFCVGCPVRRECFEDAIVQGDAYGIRGGYDLQHTRVQAFMRAARTLQRVRAIEEPDDAA